MGKHNDSAYVHEDDSSKKEPGEAPAGGDAPAMASGDQNPLKNLKNQPKVPYFSLYRYATWPERAMILLGLIGALWNAAALPLFTYIFGEILDSIGSGGNIEKEIQKLCLYFTGLGGITFVALYLETTMFDLTGLRQANRIRMLYLQAVLGQDLTFFDLHGSSGALLQSLNDHTAQIQDAISHKAGNFVHMAGTGVAGLAIAFYRAWEVTLVILGLLPFLALCGGLLSSHNARSASRAEKSYEKASQHSQECLANVKTVAAFNMKEKAVEKYSTALTPALKEGLRQAWQTGVSFGAMNFTMFLVYTVTLAFGTWRVSEGKRSGGDIINTLFACVMGGFSFGNAIPNLVYFQAGQVAAKKVYETMALPSAQSKASVGSLAPASPTLSPQAPTTLITLHGSAGGKSSAAGESSALIPSTCEGRLELDNITFRYPSRPEVCIFNGLSLNIPAGHTHALVGESGSGKSTVISLIERFYDPVEGRVLLDGVNLRALDLDWLRRQIGLVTQEPTLFATTIYENILYGRPDATREEVLEAARASNALTFIERLPSGFDTTVGERGTSMSGGQKQRIALARAVLRNPRILLLDEATSALDSESERIVQDALDRLMVGRTTVVVAHRLSTVRHASCISVVYRGKVVESGSHDELLSRPDGAFTQLVKHQQERKQTQHARQLSHSEPSSREMSTDLSGPVGTAGHRVVLDSPKEEGGHADGLRRRSAGKATDKGKDSMKNDNEPLVKVPFSRLFQYNKSEAHLIVFGCLGSAGMGALMPVFAIFLSEIIAVFYLRDKDEMMRKGGMWAGLFGAIAFWSFLCIMIQQTCLITAGHQLGRRLRVLAFQAMMRQEIAWFEDPGNTSGALGSKLSKDTMYVRGAVGDSIAALLQPAVGLIAALIIAFTASWKLTLVVLSVVPVIAVAGIGHSRYIMQGASTTDKAFANANGLAVDAFANIKVVMSFSLRPQVINLYRQMIRAPTQDTEKKSHSTGLLTGFSMASLFWMYALAFYYGTKLMRDEGLSFNEMMRVFFVLIFGAMGASQTAMAFPDIGRAKGAVQSVFGLLDRHPLIASPPNPIVPKSCEGRLELEKVTFRYPSRPEVCIFNGLSLNIPAGHTHALVGESGSGKSTVISLIERFYDPVEGRVLLDGVDLRALDLDWLRRQIGLVSQEPVLFEGSIYDNILYGRPDATREEVLEAARASNALTFIERLPSGFDTTVGERGTSMSGGQKQRIALARAVLRNPRILLLDEATSALDSESERIVQDALDRLMVGRTTVVVAHRLSTVRHASCISVVKKGKIVESGTHEALLEMNGSYAALVQLQITAKV